MEKWKSCKECGTLMEDKLLFFYCEQCMTLYDKTCKDIKDAAFLELIK